MYVLQLFYRSIDLLFRLKNRLRRLLLQKSRFSQDAISSDSQATFYENAVSKIIESDRVFNKFRRVYDYREILEHVDYDLGMEYLAIILQKNPKILVNLNEFQKNDLIGKPRTYNFAKVGKMSPTTLRYIAMAIEIAEKMGQSKFSKIVEIGGGYGGQASVLHTVEFFDEYFIYDLPDVQVLIEQFSSKRKVRNLIYPKLDETYDFEFDLLISNYAFSELPREVQNQYIQKVILKSRNGFMLMNSGNTNMTGRSDGKITISELRAIIPNLEIYPEDPLTSADNYLLVWRH